MYVTDVLMLKLQTCIMYLITLQCGRETRCKRTRNEDTEKNEESKKLKETRSEQQEKKRQNELEAADETKRKRILQLEKKDNRRIQ